MKATAEFKKAITAHLEKRAAEDALFAPVYANPDKNLDDCVTYVLNEVKKSGRNGFTDDEVYSMAVHYYDEAKIDVGAPIACDVRVSHATDADTREAYAKPKRAKASVKKPVEQHTLF